MKRAIKQKNLQFDVVVVGGGLSGMCAAIAAARHGANTALVHARSVFGGNASGEIRMHVCGASANMAKPELEEGGILYEMMLENKSRNDYFNYSIWDTVLYQAVKKEKNLTAILNTAMDDCTVENGVIQSITAYQQTTETRFHIGAKLFVDATGNGTLGYLAGAEFRTGSEGKAEFNEPHAPDAPNNDRMGNSLMFKAVDRGHSVRFKRPDFARQFSEEQLKYRTHADTKNKDGVSDAYLHITSYGSATIDTGYWWIELSGETEDIIDEYEQIRDELVACVYGVWDHLKNVSDHGAENYDLEWVGMLPGMRESRRLVGDYLLNENDVLENRRFDDAVAYGGWPMDIHTPKGLYDFDKRPTEIFDFEGAYTIPYRSYYSKNIDNLMMAGRNISATKMAMGSTRVMGTCAIGGQAVGTAAALCIQKGCTPRGLLPYMEQLQQILLKEDCYIPDLRNNDPDDLAKTAQISVSSAQAGFGGENITNGITRAENGEENIWISNGIAPEGEEVTLCLAAPAALSQIRLIFDTNFAYSIKQTQNGKRQKQQRIGIPPELVKAYRIRLLKDGKEVYTAQVTDNYQRANTVDIPHILCDTVSITFTETNGCENIHLYEIRLY